MTYVDLGRMVKQKHPGSYDQLPDEELGRLVYAKYPQYKTIVETVPQASKINRGENVGRVAAAEEADISGTSSVDESTDTVTTPDKVSEMKAIATGLPNTSASIANTPNLQSAIVSKDVLQRQTQSAHESVSKRVGDGGNKQKMMIKLDTGDAPEVRQDEILAQEGLISASQSRSQQEGLEESNLDKFLTKPLNSTSDMVQIIKAGLVPEIVAAVVSLAVKMKASDIHIEATEDNLRLRYRLDGILKDVIKMPISLHAPLTSRIKILSKLKIDEQRIPQDGRFNVVVQGHEIDLRVSTLPTVHGEKVVMRILDKSAGIISLEEMGLTGRGFDILVANISKPYGIILSTGPTGSGKSTTLYAILQKISTPGVNVITLEDPVEYEISGINQAQVKPQIGFTFAEGLRSVLRQDPNVIMVGEIRDLETAAMATHAALTGHLVLSTLHTNDASGALPRLTNMGIEPFLITSAVNAIVAQRLVRKICSKCKEQIQLPDSLMADIKEELSKIKDTKVANMESKDLTFFKGKGCSECTNGYNGRIGLFEVLDMTETLEELAVAKAPASDILQQAIKDGMITMKQDGIMKALKGITTMDEVFRVTTSN